MVKNARRSSTSEKLHRREPSGKYPEEKREQGRNGMKSGKDENRGCTCPPRGVLGIRVLALPALEQS